MIEKIIFLSLFVLCFVPIGTLAFDWMQCEEREFVLTAYYSPEDDQAFYYKEDVQDEKILNGEWLWWASWEGVFDGMLAAPASYEFGWMIYFPDFGVGKVSDRGGAIVVSWNRSFANDRIDIWMGKWEEGLVKALTFGVQKRKGYYCSESKLSSLSSDIKASIKVGFNSNSVPIFEHFFDIALRIQELYPERNDVRVRTLQKYLTKFGYLDVKKQTGYFGAKTKEALCQYQIDKLITNRQYCGVFGPKTRYIMKKDVESKGFLPLNLWQHGSMNSIHQQALVRDEAQAIIDYEWQITDYFQEPFYLNSYDYKVVKLQELLIHLNLYEWKVDGVFDQEVSNSVLAFQLQENIIQQSEVIASYAGYVGPKTREVLNISLETWENEDSVAMLVELFDEPEVQKHMFEFYRPYIRNEGPNEEIRILQKFLTELDLYGGDINGKYTDDVIDSLFIFQIKYWILEEDAHYSLQGFLGPGTRERINAMLVF